jgi:hypothetical protein
MDPRSRKCDLWLADVSRSSAKLIWSVKDVTGEVMVGFDRASGDPCLMIRGYSELTKEAPGGVALFRYDARAKRAAKVGSLPPASTISAEPRPSGVGRERMRSRSGGAISAAILSPDGRGTAALSGDTIRWSRNGEYGQETLPDRAIGHILSWSRDGKRLAVSEEEGEGRKAKTRIAVYEFIQ